MEYNGIGFSNIRLPNRKDSYIYQYNNSVNTFPEEVFVHEFLHFLERAAKERNYTVPALHDNEKYGYNNEKIIGLKRWYAAYMTKTIVDTTRNKILGLDPEIYHAKPAHESDFTYPYEIDALKEPKNIIEEISILIQRIGEIFKK